METLSSMLLRDETLDLELADHGVVGKIDTAVASVITSLEYGFRAPLKSVLDYRDKFLGDRDDVESVIDLIEPAGENVDKVETFGDPDIGQVGGVHEFLVDTSVHGKNGTDVAACADGGVCGDEAIRSPDSEEVTGPPSFIIQEGTELGVVGWQTE